MHMFWQLVVANYKSFFRDRAALFWTIAFPLVFIILFGLIFSGGGGKPSVGVVDLDRTLASASLAPTPAPSSAATPAVSGAAAVASSYTLSDAFDVVRYDSEDSAVAGAPDAAAPVAADGAGMGASEAEAGVRSRSTTPTDGLPPPPEKISPNRMMKTNGNAIVQKTAARSRRNDL